MKKIIGVGIVLILLTTMLPNIVVGQELNKYAVIVSYDGKGDCRIWASTCARLLRDILKENGFSHKNIKFLSGSKSTKENTIDAISWLKDIERADSEVVVAFFGHGSATFVLACNPGLMHEEIRDLLADLDSQKQLVIIDTCGSAGAIIEGRDGITLNATNRIVLTSTVTENESSIFSWHLTNWSRAVLLRGLKEGNADFNGDGLVSIEEAASRKGGISDEYEGEFFL